MKQAKKRDTSRFPKSIFWIVLGTLLLTAGIHVGMIVGMNEAKWPEILQAHVMVFYWLGVAVLLTVFIRSRMKVVYDAPLQKISAATKQVAGGDFSVRVEPIHSEEKEDYLDLMIHDLNAMIAELGSIETLKTDFVSNVSHEIKTPISVIQNYARLLQSDGLSEEERADYAKTISDAAKRLNLLITNILRLNRLENQRLEAKKESFDLSAQLGQCVLGFESVWEERNIDLDVDMADGVTVRSDQELLALVWNNLLSNAFKFTEPGGTVGISLTADNDFATVRITDTGCGMDEKTRKHIFDKFYQGDTSRATQGNGLGLALVKRVLDLTGGEITVESAPGNGSTFAVRIKRV